MLFGAGIALMADKLETRGRRAAGVHCRRMFWLIVIGMCHAYLLWYGDILVAYSIECATFSTVEVVKVDERDDVPELSLSASVDRKS